MNTFKTIKIVSFLLSLIVVSSCKSTQATFSSAEVNFVSSSDGTLTMRATGTGNNEGEAITNAIYNSFDVLFFKGLPESEQKSALIGSNENEERGRHKDYFDSFYTGRYQSFVMSSMPVSKLVKYNGGKKGISVDVKINLVALRRDLEQYNIIRKFGF